VYDDDRELLEKEKRVSSKKSIKEKPTEGQMGNLKTNNQ